MDQQVTIYLSARSREMPPEETDLWAYEGLVYQVLHIVPRYEIGHPDQLNGWVVYMIKHNGPLVGVRGC